MCFVVFLTCALVSVANCKLTAIEQVAMEPLLQFSLAKTVKRDPVTQTTTNIKYTKNFYVLGAGLDEKQEVGVAEDIKAIVSLPVTLLGLVNLYTNNNFPANISALQFDPASSILPAVVITNYESSALLLKPTVSTIDLQASFDATGVAYLDMPKAIAHVNLPNSLPTKNLIRIYNVNILRKFVPEYFRDWNTPWVTYDPKKWLAPWVKANEFDWADKDETAADCIFHGKDGRINRKSYVMRFPGDTQGYDIETQGPYKGFPRNPQGRTGIDDRGVLGKWGPNHACDAFLVFFECEDSEENRKNPECYIVIVLMRAPGADENDKPVLATVGGIVDNGETPEEAILREIMEELFVDMNLELAEYEAREIDNIRRESTVWEQNSPPLGNPTKDEQDAHGCLDAKLAILYRIHVSRQLIRSEQRERIKLTQPEIEKLEKARMDHKAQWDQNYPEFMNISKRVKEMKELETKAGGKRNMSGAQSDEWNRLDGILKTLKKNLTTKLLKYKAGPEFQIDFPKMKTNLKDWRLEMSTRLNYLKNTQLSKIQDVTKRFYKLVNEAGVLKKVLFKNQCDDYRNTDRAWMETICYMILCDKNLLQFIKQYMTKTPSLESVEVKLLPLTVQELSSNNFFASHRAFFLEFMDRVRNETLNSPQFEDARFPTTPIFV